MYQQYDPSDDSSIEDGHMDNVPKSALEQRLKQIRPRQPQLDFAAIERIAMHTKRTAQSIFSMKQFASVIAASWLVGFAVGASCVFYLTTNRQHAMPNQETSAKNISNAISPNTFEPLPLDQSNLLTINSASGKETPMGRLGADLDFELNSRPLSFGSSLRSHSRLIRIVDFESDPLPVRPDDNSIETDVSLASKFSPPQPVTQAELMRELLKTEKTIH